MTAYSVGQYTLREESVSKAIDILAKQKYVLKEICMIQKSNAWADTYFQETAAHLTGGQGSAVKGIPRLAAFPYGEQTWTRVTKYMMKHGMDGMVSYEDWRTDYIDVLGRTLINISNAITKSVDDDIWDTISESQAGGTINTLSITAGYEWDSDTVSNRDPIQDILNAMKEIAIDNYNPYNNGYLLLNPKDYANLLGNANVRNAGQFYTDSVTKNGTVGRICGLTVKVSKSITNDYAMVIVGKLAAKWFEVQGLTSKRIEDPGKSWTIRAWEMGVCGLIHPLAVCLIDNTQK